MPFGFLESPVTGCPADCLDLVTPNGEGLQAALRNAKPERYVRRHARLQMKPALGKTIMWFAYRLSCFSSGILCRLKARDPSEDIQVNIPFMRAGDVQVWGSAIRYYCYGVCMQMLCFIPCNAHSILFSRKNEIIIIIIITSHSTETASDRQGLPVTVSAVSDHQ